MGGDGALGKDIFECQTLGWLIFMLPGQEEVKLGEKAVSTGIGEGDWLRSGRGMLYLNGK